MTQRKDYKLGEALIKKGYVTLAHVTEALQAVPGAASAVVSLEAGRATVQWRPEAVGEEAPLLKAVRKQLKLLSPDVKIDVEQIRNVLEHEVLKRDVVEGDKAEGACKRIAKAVAKAGRASAKDEESDPPAQLAAQTTETAALASAPTPAATVVPNPLA